MIQNAILQHLMDYAIDHLAQLIVLGLVPVVMLAFRKLSAAAIEAFDAHVKNTAYQAAFAKLMGMAEVVVRRHSQQFVDDLKVQLAAGRISSDAYHKALADQKSEALTELEQLMTPAGMEKLAADLGITANMGRAFLAWTIEHVVHSIGQAAPSSVATTPAAATPAAVAAK